ncbi:MAG TPA: phosphodiester glycosidase family protein, partial [Longimicrobium sp.]
MMRPVASLAVCAAAAFASPLGAQRGEPMTVTRAVFEGDTFIVARADMGRVRLRMLSAGGGIGSYADAEAVLRRRGERMLLATNGGLFDRGPIGLHYEDGRAVRGLNLDTAPPRGQKPGNFYYLPNGVLYQDRAGNVAIRDSRHMRGRLGEVRDGTQSGPALVLRGVVHPVARPPNRGVAHANRVAACVTGPRELAIVFVRQPSTFPRLARFLLGRLGCRDAVFLD